MLSFESYFLVQRMGFPPFGDVWHKPRYRRLWPPYSGACAHAFSKASFPGAIVKPGF